MIKFFRTIRQNLLNDGKTGKYLKYAIGEIALVVIGIFIALQLNIWNETRKNEQEFTTILKEVQKDLGLNIQQSNILFDYYEHRDSIITLALQDKLSKENYVGINKFEVIYVAMNAYHLKVHDHGYQNFSENLDNVPEAFEALIEPLNEIYTYNKYEIDKFDLRLDKITDRLMDDLAADHPWHHKLALDEINDSIISFFLHDPFYKNAISLYANAADNLMFHVGWFDDNAVRAYLQIRDLTGHPEVLPDFIPQNRIPVNTLMYEELLGAYRLVLVRKKNGKRESILDIPYTMKMGRDGLELVDESTGTTQLLYFKSDTSLYSVTAEVSLVRDSDAHVSKLMFEYPLYDVEYLRVE